VLRRIVNNSIASGVSVAARMAISIVLTPYLIHALGAEMYGIWVLALSFSISGYLAMFTLGIQSALIKAVAGHHARGDLETVSAVFTAALAAYAILGALGAASVYVFAHRFMAHVFTIPPAHVAAATGLLSIVALQVLIDFPVLALDGLLAGLQRFSVLSLWEIARGVLFALAAYTLVHAGGGVRGIAGVLVGLSLATLITYTVVARRLLPSLRLSRDLTGQAVVDMALMSGKMLLLRVNALVYGQMDKVILGVFLTTTVLTDYDVAARFHGLVLVAMGLISSVIMPAASALHATGDRDNIRRLFFKGTKFSTAASLPLTIMLMVLALPLLRLWIGPEFARDAGLTRLFLAYTVFWPLVNVGWNMMIGMDEANRILKIQVGTTIINVAISVLVTLRVGIAGVLWGTLVGNALASVFYLRLFFAKVGVRPTAFLREVIAPVYPLAIGVGALFLGVVTQWPPRSLAATATYGAGFMVVYTVAFAIWGLDAADRSYLGALWDDRPRALRVGAQ
jgi:O-antigen/teichoic acid export membrane protein